MVIQGSVGSDIMAAVALLATNMDASARLTDGGVNLNFIDKSKKDGIIKML